MRLSGREEGAKLLKRCGPKAHRRHHPQGLRLQEEPGNAPVQDGPEMDLASSRIQSASAVGAPSPGSGRKLPLPWCVKAAH